MVTSPVPAICVSVGPPLSGEVRQPYRVTAASYLTTGISAGSPASIRLGKYNES